MIKVNCDIGERGCDHKVDLNIMKHVDIANIACGGHAGDEKSVDTFRRLAEKYGSDVSAHLSYPDKKNFGRMTMDIAPEQLVVSLDKQYSMMPDINWVKFHGALYNDSCKDTALSTHLVQWLKANTIQKVITTQNSALAIQCIKTGIEVVKEMFAERRYQYDETDSRLSLVSRQEPDASIVDIDDAMEHVRMISKRKEVMARHIPSMEVKPLSVEVDTICIHSDSVISLELVTRIKKEIM